MLSGDQLWYKDAIIYQLHVKSFFDANNDGIGDFPGLISKLDYIADLGVNALWLLPFYPSPRRDDGYDIADYRDVHPEYGKMADVKQLHRRRPQARHPGHHRAGDQPHLRPASVVPARPAAPSPARPRATSTSGPTPTRSIRKPASSSSIPSGPTGPGTRWPSAYYWHRFYSHQPDLNFDNPRVLEAVLSVMRFWLDLGVDGLRLDAVPYLVEREGTNNENLPETHEVLKKIRAELDAHLSRTACCWPRPTSGRRTPRTISARATNATWRSISR